MSLKEVYKVFLGKNVNVGTPNFFDPKKLFLITGYVIAVSEEYLILRNQKSVKKIALIDISVIEINVTGGSQ